jgi:hypothetical protein
MGAKPGNGGSWIRQRVHDDQVHRLKRVESDGRRGVVDFADKVAFALQTEA